ncbi:hypothetical protein PUNSTDRAFT_145875 [Punctularia strigosozonata HHB-11173 SS5]|uniref:uncharacterized protein n=1 Tax=Punctularia strigosozonata (strain HHB-11173) TaxID=741275 RepID=UPI00044167A2|nr:uncharacterized protein PUNSTDRAFT_145875 [Punctularia strigosozonata HHB-11173 SS5]EIN05433.1 hypothetical protein PUNSTDRAFT_145875 [Punctularia strigosozonata HHB-11173 SS5]
MAAPVPEAHVPFNVNREEPVVPPIVCMNRTATQIYLELHKCDFRYLKELHITGISSQERFPWAGATSLPRLHTLTLEYHSYSETLEFLSILDAPKIRTLKLSNMDPAGALNDASELFHRLCQPPLPDAAGYVPNYSCFTTDLHHLELANVHASPGAVAAFFADCKSLKTLTLTNCSSALHDTLVQTLFPDECMVRYHTGADSDCLLPKLRFVKYTPGEGASAGSLEEKLFARLRVLFAMDGADRTSILRVLGNWLHDLVGGKNEWDRQEDVVHLILKYRWYSRPCLGCSCFSEFLNRAPKFSGTGLKAHM